MKTPKLTQAEIERLALLSEELGEVQQAIGKILRHGYENSHPDIPERTNRRDLERELGHLNVALILMLKASDLSSAEIKHYRKLKLTEINKYLHHQKT